MRLFLVSFIVHTLGVYCLENEGSKYHSYKEIEEILRKEEANHKELVTTIEIGHSVEGRPITGVKISRSPQNQSRPAILIDAGLHPREWSTVALALHTIDQLLNNEANSNLTDGLDWYIFPVLNPDGYVYSMESTKGRLWRKNRARTYILNCDGVDLNRNFGYAWGGPGSSDNPCSDIYRGPHPFSEPETVAFANFVLSVAKSIKVYLAVHSSAQALLYPYGFTTNMPDDWKDLRKLAVRAEEAVAAIRGTRLKIGTSTELLGYGSGGSDDWGKGSAGIKYVYTVELPNKNYAYEGFHPPVEDLPLIASEMFEGIRIFAETAKQL